MKYIKLYEYYNDLESELDRHYIKNYNINNDNTIDVIGDVYLNNLNLKEIPFQFGKVNGNFDCGYNQLTSLKGAPNYVGGYFSCNSNKLTNLEYVPKYVNVHFNCSNNDIRYIPPDLDIEGDLYIDNNPITIIFRHDIDNKQILEELDIYNPISKNGLTVYKTKLKDMYQQLGILNEFDNHIKRLSKYYKII